MPRGDMQARIVRLDSYPSLNILREDGMAWDGARPELRVLVVALEGVADWAACCETMRTGDGVSSVASYGVKVAEPDARELFPELRNLPYRR